MSGTMVPAEVEPKLRRVEALEEDAKSISARGRRDQVRLGRCLRDLRQAKAHRLRGYRRWEDYVRDTFGFSREWAGVLIRLVSEADAGADVDGISIRAAAGCLSEAGIGRQRVCAALIDVSWTEDLDGMAHNAFGNTEAESIQHVIEALTVPALQQELLLAYEEATIIFTMADLGLAEQPDK